MRPPHAGVQGAGQGEGSWLSQEGKKQELRGRPQSSARGRKELKSKDRRWPIVARDWSPHSR